MIQSLVNSAERWYLILGVVVGGTGEGGSTTGCWAGEKQQLCVNKSPCLINLAPALPAYTAQIFYFFFYLRWKETIPHSLFIASKPLCCQRTQFVRTRGRKEGCGSSALSKHQTATPRAQKWGAFTKGIETEGAECREIHFTSTDVKNPCWYEAKKIIPKWEPTYFSSSRFLFLIFHSYLTLINRKYCTGRCRWTVKGAWVQFSGVNNKLLVFSHSPSCPVSTMALKSCLAQDSKPQSSAKCQEKSHRITKSKEKCGPVGSVPELSDENKQRDKDMG